MLDKPTANTFSHVKPGDTPWVGEGLRDFFLYRDLGVATATGGRVLAQLVKANSPPEEGTGWHQHVADFHIVIMLKGWARFMYEGEEHLVAAGDCVHQRPGITHYLFDYSPDMEYLEVVAPADFQTLDVEGPCAGTGADALDQARLISASELDFQFLDLLRLELRRRDPLDQIGPAADMRAISGADGVHAQRHSCGSG